MEFLPVIVWIVIIVFGVYSANKKKNTADKTIVPSKKPQEFKAIDFRSVLTSQKPKEAHDFNFEIFLGKENESSQENESTENTRYVRKNIEEQVVNSKLQKQAKPERNLTPIKSTKPIKPEKPKKENKYEGFEEYAQHTRKQNPINKFMENPENIRNAFILSEIFNKKF